MGRKPNLTHGIIAAYLVAIVIANNLVWLFGQKALVVTAFLLIPFDLASRDFLHEKWHHKNLKRNMATLILAGAVLTFLTNHAAYRVSIASCSSFFLAALVDTLVYHKLFHRSRLTKMNASNACSSIADSFAFPTIAFGSVNIGLSVTQSVLKIIGGVFWAFVINSLWRRHNEKHNGKLSGHRNR